MNKQKEKNKEKEFLSKKRFEPDSSSKQEVDMVKLKKKVNEIMISICDEAKVSNNDLDTVYESMKKKYLLNELTPNCFKYINRIITDTSKNHLSKFQGIFELNKIFISIIKELLMNEFELILLSLYIELIDISSNNNIPSFKESLIFLCFLIKKLTLSEEYLAPINSFLNRKYQRFDEKFKTFLEQNSSVLDKKPYFNYVEFNEKFKEFNKTNSVYCKNNYIDYNLIIDRILNMSIPYNENKSDNLFISKKINPKNNTDLIFESSNISFSGNNNKINFNQNNLINNSNINNINNQNNFPNYFSGYPGEIYLTQNNNNINYLYNKNNIICPINTLNNGQSNTNFNNKEIFISSKHSSQIQDNKNNNANNNIQNDSTKKINKNKLLFVTQEQKNENNNTNKEKLNENFDTNKNEKNFTPNNLLYSLGNENNNEQNNNANNYKRNNSKNSVNSNIINYNENLNLIQNNLFGLNTSQQMNDYNQMKYNNNLGINDINSASQISFISLKNPYYADINNNIYYNIFQGQEDDNYRQLINPSNDNFFRSYLNINDITSSKNFYPNLNNNNNVNINYANTNIQENINNNINYLRINALLQGNPNNISNTLNNLANTEGLVMNKLTQEKNNNNNVNNDIKENK